MSMITENHIITNEDSKAKIPRGLFGWMIGRVRSFSHAGRGLLILCLNELHFQIHLGGATLAIALGFFFRISSVEWLILIQTIFAVLVAEVFNTALEHLVDLVQREHHPLVRDAKDLAATAVLLTSIAAAIIGIILFGPPIFRLFAR